MAKSDLASTLNNYYAVMLNAKICGVRFVCSLFEVVMDLCALCFVLVVLGLNAGVQRLS